jgi:hypothetical protein
MAGTVVKKMGWVVLSAKGEGGLQLLDPALSHPKLLFFANFRWLNNACPVTLN